MTTSVLSFLAQPQLHVYQHNVSYGEFVWLKPQEAGNRIVYPSSLNKQKDISQLLLEFKQRLAQLQAPEIECILISPGDEGYEIQVVGNNIPVELREKIHEIDFALMDQHPDYVVDLWVRDRRDKLLSELRLASSSSEGSDLSFAFAG